MLPAWLLALCSFEVGTWTGVLFRRIFSSRRAKQEDLLLYGAPGAKDLGIIDRMLKKRAGDLTGPQMFAANKGVKAMRWFVNTKAFEYSIQHYIRDGWPIKDEALDPEVKICL